MMEQRVSAEVLEQYGIDPKKWYFTSWLFYGPDKEPIGVDMDLGSRLTQTNVDNLIKYNALDKTK